MEKSPPFRDWNRRDGRAFAASSEMRRGLDVVPATPKLAAAEGAVMGVGVSRVGGVAMPLLWVSGAVAADRGSGVKEGWYVVAEPGMGFEVSVMMYDSHGAFASAGRVGRNAVMANLLVDGQLVDESWQAFDWDQADHERVCYGFVAEEEQGADGTVVSENLFRFRKAELVDEKEMSVAGGAAGDEDKLDAASIKLLVEAAHRTRLVAVDASKAGKAATIVDAKPIWEKDAAKGGQSLSVERSGAVKQTKFALTQYSYSGYTPQEHLETVIHVRERFWMRSRRLIDDAGAPASAKTAAMLLRRDSGAFKTSPEKRLSAKRVRTPSESEAIRAIIDLSAKKTKAVPAEQTTVIDISTEEAAEPVPGAAHEPITEIIDLS